VAENAKPLDPRQKTKAKSLASTHSKKAKTKRATKILIIKIELKVV